jgi:hypothetical protein
VVSISEDSDNDNACYLDNYSDSSKQAIKDMLISIYETEWQRTHDIEHKASSIIGFVGIIFTLTIASLSTILVEADEITRDKIFYSSIYSPIAIFLLLSFMALSIIFGILAINVKKWHVPFADKFLTYCKKIKTGDELLEAICNDYVGYTIANKATNDKTVKYLRLSLNLFAVSIVVLVIFTLVVINSFK